MNDAPVAVTMTVHSGGHRGGVPGVLGNDSDVDGDPLSYGELGE